MNDSYLGRLCDLRDQVDHLINKPRLCEEFRVWHYEFITAARENYDQGTDELTAIYNLSFESPPELVDNLKSVIENMSAHANNFRSAANEFLQKFENELEDLQQSYYRKRLLEAKEMITTMILDAKKNSDCC